MTLEPRNFISLVLNQLALRLNLLLKFGNVAQVARLLKIQPLLKLRSSLLELRSPAFCVV